MILRNSSYSSTLTTDILRAKEDFFCIDNYISNIKFKLSDKDSVIFTNYEILKKYENILIDNSVFVELKEENYYRPEYLSYILYNTTHLWYLLLFLNKCANCSDFKKEKVRVIHPDKIYILSEIYNNEKDYINSENSSDLVLKSLYSKSDFITLPPNFSIGVPSGNRLDDDINEDDVIGYEPIEYNLSRAYLTIPYNNIRPMGLIYESDYVTGSILSKDDQIVSFKPMHVGGSCRVFLDNQLLFETKNNNSDLEILKSKVMLPMNYVLDTKYEFSESVNWYNNFTNGLLLRIKSDDFIKLPLVKELRVRLVFEGGDTLYSRQMNILDEMICPVDISSNYGKLESISISVLGDLTKNNKECKINVSYQPCYFDYNNILLAKNDYYNLRIECTKMEEFYPMISYSFKDYKIIDSSDLIMRRVQNNLPLLPDTASPNSIIINNSTTFKGLQLISLIDNHELEHSDIYENHLEDKHLTDLNDQNEKLLLYKKYDSKNGKITDFYISTNIYCRNNLSKINGSMGLFFKGRNKGGKISTYIYMLKMKNEYSDHTKSLIHGLYKMDSNNEDNIYLDSDSLNFSNLVKIADTPQFISGNQEYPTFIKIVTNKNNIRIYDGKQSRPIIEYFDNEEIVFDEKEQPMFGLALFNVRNPGYINLTVNGKNNYLN